MFAVSVLRPDFRRSSEPDESRTKCRRCGARIVVLPEDRRLGYCFDCFDPSEIHVDGLLTR